MLKASQAYNKLSKLKSEVSDVDGEFLKLGNEQGLQKLNTQITQQEAKLSSLKLSYQQASNSMNNLGMRQQQANAKMEQSKQTMASSKNRIMQLRQSLGSLSSVTKGSFMANVTSKLKNVGNAASSMIHKFQNGVSAIKKFGSGIANVGSKVGGAIAKFSLLGRAATGAKNKIANFSKGISQNLRMINSIVMSMLIMQLMQILTDGFKRLAGQSDSFNKSMSKLYSSFAYLKNSIVAAFQPLATAVAPMIANIVNTIANAINKLGELFAALTGQKTYTKAVYQSKDFASSMNDSANSTNAATEANENYKKSLAGFDEITKLDSQDNNSSGEGTGTGTGGGADDAGSWKTEKVNVASSLADDIKNGDWSSVGKALGEKINSALSSIDWPKIQKKVNGIASNIADFLNGAMEAIDWSLVGSTIGNGINTVLGFFNTFITKFDWEKLGTSIATTLNSTFSTIDWSLVGSTLGNSIEAVIDTAFGFVETFDWNGVGSDLATAVNDCFDKIDFNKAGKTLGDGVKGICKSISSFFAEVDWEAIGKDVVSFITSVDWLGMIFEALKALQSFTQGCCDFAKGIFDGIVDAIKNADWGKVAKDVWNCLVEEIKLLNTPIMNVTATLATKAKDLADKLKDDWDKLKDKTLEAVAELKTKINETKEKIKQKWKEITADWKEKVAKLKVEAKQKANEIKQKWKEKTKEWKEKTVELKAEVKTTVKNVKSWWKDRADEWKDKEVEFTIRAKNKIEELKKGFKEAINTVIGWINKYIIDNLNKVSIQIPSFSIAGQTFGGQTFGFNVDHIKTFKDGGFPDGEDGLFYANHNEMIGTFSNGKTAVANNQQIVEGISTGVYSAVKAAMGNGNGQNNNSTPIYVYIGGKQITDYVVKDVNSRTRKVGINPILI